MVRTSQLTRDACGPPPSIPFSCCSYYAGNQDPHKSLQPIRSSNSRSRLPEDQRSTTVSTEIHGKEHPNQLPLSVSFPRATPARRVGSFRGCLFVMIFLAVVIPDEDHGIGLVFAYMLAEIGPKTIVAYGFTFSCRLALLARFNDGRFRVTTAAQLRACARSSSLATGRCRRGAWVLPR